MFTRKTGLLAATMIGGLALSGQAHATLSLFQQYSGPGFAASSSGCGSTTQTCTLTANLPAGSTVQAAYLYSSLYNGQATPGGTLTLGANSTNLTYTALGQNASATFLQAWRADVTGFIQSNLATGANTLTVTETNSFQDGEGLVVVYSDPTKSASSVIILDGSSATAGDTSHIVFSPLPAGFTADMRIGDGFSFDGPDPNNPTNTAQVSTITVNGTTLTDVAGHCDDAQDASCSNGNLITVGADSDPYTPFPNPLIGQDHERYNLGNILAVGDTAATLTTINPSNNDNIFLELFQFSVPANVVVPEPASLALLGAGLAGLGLIRRRRA